MISIRDIIDKRRARWEEKGDLEYDKVLIEASVKKILETPSLREEVLAKPYLLIEVAFYIVDKKKDTVPFFLNEVQKDFIGKLETLGTSKPYYILKGRQQGFTSLVTAIQLCFAIVRKNFSGFTIANSADNSMTIFNDKARVVYDRLPELLKPHEKYNSKKEMFFDKLNSSWRIATATKDIARSKTLNFVHFSEVAFYECAIADLQAGIGEAITADAIQIYETTANGFNQAKDLWDNGSCHNIFYGWWRSGEYRSTEYEYLQTTDTWLVKRKKVLEGLGLDKEQITWYCKKYASYVDKSKIKQEYPITPEEAFISSGDCVFDKEAIQNQIARLSGLQAAKKGYFTYEKNPIPVTDPYGKLAGVEWKLQNIRFVERQDGYITIHEEPRTKKNEYGEITHKAPYVIGGDTAGSGKDYFTAKVICNLDDKTVATLHKQNIDEDLYAEQVYCLGKYYHDALIGIEINYSRHPTRILQEYAYPNLYMREKVDGLTDKVVLEHGFLTSVKTKPIIIGELVKLMRDKPSSEVDIPTLKEMTTFVKKEHGKMEAIEGCHDDLVMAKAIAHFIGAKQVNDWIETESQGQEFLSLNFKEEKGHYLAGENSNANYIDWGDL